MIYEHFRATGAHEAEQRLSDLFNTRLQNDDIQDFDVRWDQALLSASDVPSDVILDGLYKSKLQDSVQLQTVLALYDQETARDNGHTSYVRLKTSVKLHIDQMMTTRNFSLERSCGERSSHQESKRKESLRREESGRVSFSGRHMDNVPKETHVVSVMTLWPLETRAKVRDEKDDRLLPHQIRKQNRLTARDKKSSQGSGSKQENSLDKSEFPCQFKFCKNPSCKFWHRPVRQKYKTEKGCASLATNAISEMSRQKERLSCDIEEVFTIGLCISRFLSEKIYST